MNRLTKEEKELLARVLKDDLIRHQQSQAKYPGRVGMTRDESIKARIDGVRGLFFKLGLKV